METVLRTAEPIKLTRRQRNVNRYVAVNGAWPDEVPKPTPQEAIAGCRLLLREGFRFYGWPNKTKRVFKLTSGNRHTWPRRNVWYVNPDERGRGWKEIVHSVSHWCHQRRYPGLRGHDVSHAGIEKHLVEYVVNSGWLTGKLRRPEKVKPVTDIKAERRAKVLARLAVWERKRKRADTAIKKLRKQVRYYER